MTYYERYKIALEKAKEVEKMPLNEWRKKEIYAELGKWIETEKSVEELPFPFNKIPRRVE